MTEFVLGVLDHTTGQFVVDEETPAAPAAQDDLDTLIGRHIATGCAKPQRILLPPMEYPFGTQVRISGYWHNSFIEGPGRRSVVRFQGCPIRCSGCYVPQTWDASSGIDVNIGTMANLLLDPGYERDGVTILGGEPFAQPKALAFLVCALLGRQPGLHITVYSGFTLEALQRRNDPNIDYVLSEINILIDGPYVKALASSAGPWTGSSNQRVLELKGNRP